MGLTICKGIIEKLGGTITVSSEVDKGSSFQFEIPVEEQHKPMPAESEGMQSLSLKGKKILVVEDDESSMLLLKEILDSLEANYIEARSGEVALRLFQENTDIDLILMDIQLPGMNGYETTSKIRERNKDVVIIAQTANAMASDREKSVLAGCNDYIPKPISIPALIKIFNQYLPSL